MKAVCEACGAPDRASQEQMVRRGIRELPDIIGFRPPICCDSCRGILISMVQTLRQDSAEGTIERERAAAGDPPLTPEELARQARTRWEHKPAIAEVLTAANGN